jgi:transposase
VGNDDAGSLRAVVAEVAGRMNREQKIQKARELRAGGEKYREIAEEFGVSTTAAYAWVNPERVAPYRNGRAINPERARETDRLYRKTHRTACTRCGGDRPRQTKGPHCRACIEDAADARGRKLERLWAEGLPLRQIASQMGISLNVLSTDMHRFREKGYDLPYRRRVHSTADGKPRFPEQVAA